MKPAGHFTLSAAGSERQEVLCSGDAREGSRRLPEGGLPLGKPYPWTTEAQKFFPECPTMSKHTP